MSNLFISNVGVVDWAPDVWRFIVRLLLSTICGVLIGLERKTRSKEAGIRTHAIVCMAACLFMIISKYMVSGSFSDTGVDGDPTRIASQVVTGIGFLGAGIIIYRRDIMHGLTTAAGVWATAAVGMAIGSGFIVIGVVTTAFILMLQIIFHLPIKALQTKHLIIIKLKVWIESDEVLSNVKSALGNGKITGYKVKNEDGKLIASMEFTTRNEFSVDKMNTIIRSFPDHVLSVESNEE